jgi:hypothetical protein
LSEPVSTHSLDLPRQVSHAPRVPPCSTSSPWRGSPVSTRGRGPPDALTRASARKETKTKRRHSRHLAALGLRATAGRGRCGPREMSRTTDRQKRLCPTSTIRPCGRWRRTHSRSGSRGVPSHSWRSFPSGDCPLSASQWRSTEATGVLLGCRLDPPLVHAG